MGVVERSRSTRREEQRHAKPWPAAVQKPASTTNRNRYAPARRSPQGGCPIECGSAHRHEKAAEKPEHHAESGEVQRSAVAAAHQYRHLRPQFGDQGAELGGEALVIHCSVVALVGKIFAELVGLIVELRNSELQPFDAVVHRLRPRRYPDYAAAERYAELTLSAATALNPYIGYDKASEIVKEAAASGRSLREVARERASTRRRSTRRSIIGPWLTRTPRGELLQRFFV